MAETISESHAQEASISREPVTERSLAQSAEPNHEQGVETGVGPDAPIGPDPSLGTHDRETTEITRDQQPEREQLTPDQQPAEPEHDLDRDVGLGIE